jgi:hypothetical protein
MNWKGEAGNRRRFQSPDSRVERRAALQLPDPDGAPKKLLSPNKKMKTQTKKNCGPWKSGNPKPGFPLFHRPESPAAQGKELPFTQNS